MKNILIMAVMLSIGCIAMTQAQFDRTKQPQAGAAPSIKLPAVQRATLPNGLNVVVVEHHELPVVQMQMVFRTGASADPMGKAGTASLAADMLDEGTATRTSLQLADEIDFLGAELNTSASFDGSFVNLTTLKEHLDEATGLFADVVLHPSFPSSEFDRIKKELLTDLMTDKDRPEIISTNIFYTRLYGRNHPYGYQATGSESTAAAISLDDVKEYYQKFYVPNNATIVAVGDIRKDDVVRLAEKYFSDWKQKSVAAEVLPSASNASKTTMYLMDKPGAPQSQIRLGNVAMPRNSEDYFAVSLLQQIIGSSNGRLFLNLREAKGYTYGAYAQFSMRRAAGPFLAYAGVRTDVTDSSMIEFMKEFNRIRTELVPEEEFNMYKAAVIQRLPRVFETPAQISGQLSSVVVYNLPDDYFDSLVDNYKKVTREDIMRVAQQYLKSDSLSIVIVGDKAKIKEKLEKLGIGSVVSCDEYGRELTQ